MLLNVVLYLSSVVFGSRSVLPLDLGHSSARGRWIGDGRGYTSLPWTLAVSGLCAWLQGRGTEVLALTAGAQAGMVVLSIIKRRCGLPQGAPFPPWDHLDFILGASLLCLFYQGISWQLVVGGLVLCGPLHWLLGGAIKLALEPWRERDR